MNSLQYEELCRFVLAEKVGVPVEQVRSVLLPSPGFPGLPHFRHQIDLYWETGDEMMLYLNIANAKWRGEANVDQADVLLLQQVKSEVQAHKAVMITNTGFTSGARAAAQHHGIALHVIRPGFDWGTLDARERSVVLSQIQELASTIGRPPYIHEVVYRAFDLQALAEPSPSQNRRIASLNRGPERLGAVQKVVHAPNRQQAGGGSSIRTIEQRVITPPETRGRGKAR